MIPGSKTSHVTKEAEAGLPEEPEVLPEDCYKVDARVEEARGDNKQTISDFTGLVYHFKHATLPSRKL